MQLSHKISWRKALGAFLLLFFLAGCSNKPAQTSHSDSPPTPTPMNKTALPGFEDYAPGPALAPASECLQALQQSPPEGWILLPVVMEWSADFPGGIERAYGGFDTETPEAERLYLELDDLEMGIPLSDHCEGETVCRRWLMGEWESEQGEAGAWRMMVRGVREEGPGEEAVVWLEK